MAGQFRALPEKEPAIGHMPGAFSHGVDGCFALFMKL